ncbi:MAG: ATP-binding cassette domain-containing protein [Chloroflexaceae bacterium]|nr:ATP-binding cassette domain-containing protein [Chloroflexaceae bacterium]
MLRDINLTVRPGEAYGLIGQPGAGKSTLIHLFLGFLQPDQGRVRLFGIPQPGNCPSAGGLYDRTQRLPSAVSGR